MTLNPEIWSHLSHKLADFTEFVVERECVKTSFSGVTAFASDDLTTRAEHAQCFGIHLDEAQVILNATAVT